MPTGIIGFLKRLWWTFKSLDNIGVFLFDYTGKIKNQDLIYQTRNGLKIAARAGTADKSEVILIFSDREYPKKYFPQKQRPVIVDIGAHIGCFSLYVFKELVGEKPIIYSVEPSRINFEYLERNNRMNEANLHCCEVAIGGKDGFGFIDTRRSPDTFYVEETKRSKYYQKCQTMTLEGFCQREGIKKIDLLKVDCEGAEHKIFNQAIDFIKKNVRSVFVEVHHIGEFENYQNFETYILQNNFRIVRKIFPTVIFVRNKADD